MPKLLDFLTFRETDPRRSRIERNDDDQLSAEEREALALLPRGYPPDAVDIETVSEYRLASLMQYPHY